MLTAVQSLQCPIYSMSRDTNTVHKGLHGDSQLTFGDTKQGNNSNKSKLRQQNQTHNNSLNKQFNLIFTNLNILVQFHTTHKRRVDLN